MAYPRNEKLRAAIKKGIYEGLTTRQIAERGGFKFTTVGPMINRMRKAGEIPPRDGAEMTSYRLMRQYQRVTGVQTGYIGDVIEQLDQDTVTWLHDQVPKDGTIADAIAEVIISLRTGT